jgi:peptidoglycan-associated lipoprotein
MIKKTMTGLLILVFISASLLFTASCATTQKDTSQEQARLEEEARKAEQARKEEEARKAEQERQRRMAEEERRRQEEQQRAADRARQLMREVESEKIYFDYDRSELKPEARAVLTKKAEWLQDNTEYNIRIEGHCDERGSTEYNLALGERRAEAAAKFLKALRVSGDRITTVSYGEQMPVDPGHNETAWAKNRRDEFKLEK